MHYIICIVICTLDLYRSGQLPIHWFSHPAWTKPNPARSNRKIQREERGAQPRTMDGPPGLGSGVKPSSPFKFESNLFRAACLCQSTILLNSAWLNIGSSMLPTTDHHSASSYLTHTIILLTGYILQIWWECCSENWLQIWIIKLHTIEYLLPNK